MSFAKSWALLALLPIACGGAAAPTPVTPLGPEASSQPSSAPAASQPAAKPVVPAGKLPDTAVGKQLAWVLDKMLTPGTSATAAELTAHFSDVFLKQVSVDKLGPMFSLLSAQVGPVTYLRAEKESATDLIAIARAKTGDTLRIFISTTDAAPFTVVGLRIVPAPDLDRADPVFTSYADAERTLHAIAPQVSYLVAERTPSGCTKLAGSGEDQARPISTAFRLYVLAALADDVAKGKRAWTDVVKVQDGKKSLPGGDLRNAPAGKEYTVRNLADLMIGASDNTATDHLLALLGRDAVEAEVAASGHAHPELMTPFLSTRDLFTFKLLLTPDEQQEYLRADLPGKRKLLAVMEQRDVQTALKRAASWTSPQFVDRVEWFASPSDLCRLAVKLDAAGPAVREILAKPEPAAHDYTYLGFAGGHEPGVLELTWFLDRARDGKKLFVAVAFENTAQVIDEGVAIGAVSGLRAFLASGH